MHRLRGVVPVLVATAGLMGCASSSGTSGKQAGAAGSAAASSADGGATGAGAADLTRKDMIVTAACAQAADGYTIEVTGWDAKNWSQVAHTTFPLPATVRVHNGGNAIAELCRARTNDEIPVPVAGNASGIKALFNRDYTRMAVAIGTDDSTSHIGYVDRSGQVTDLTGDSFSTTPTERNAVFSADGSAVWFTHDDDSNSDTLVASRSVNGDHKLVDRWRGTGGTEPFIVPPPSGTGPVAVGRDIFFSPDGARLLANGSLLDASAAKPVFGPDDKGNDQPLAACHGAGWTGPTTVLCEGADHNFSTRDIATSTTSPDLLPTTDHADFNLLISPDGTRFLFASISGSQVDYYVASTSPSSRPQTPTRATGLDPSVPAGQNAIFLEWR